MKRNRYSDLDLEFFLIKDNQQKIIHEKAEAELLTMRYWLDEKYHDAFKKDCRNFFNRIARKYIA